MEHTSIFNTEILMLGIKTVILILLVVMPYTVVLKEDKFDRKLIFFIAETISKVAVIYAGVFLSIKGF